MEGESIGVGCNAVRSSNKHLRGQIIEVDIYRLSRNVEHGRYLWYASARWQVDIIALLHRRELQLRIESRVELLDGKSVKQYIGQRSIVWFRLAIDDNFIGVGRHLVLRSDMDIACVALARLLDSLEIIIRTPLQIYVWFVDLHRVEVTSRLKSFDSLAIDYNTIEFGVVAWLSLDKKLVSIAHRLVLGMNNEVGGLAQFTQLKFYRLTWCRGEVIDAWECWFFLFGSTSRQGDDILGDIRMEMRQCFSVQINVLEVWQVAQVRLDCQLIGVANCSIFCHHGVLIGDTWVCEQRVDSQFLCTFVHGGLNMCGRVCMIGIVNCLGIKAVQLLAVDHDRVQRSIIWQNRSSEVDTIVRCIVFAVVNCQVEVVRGLLYNHGVWVECTCETNHSRTLVDGVLVGSTAETLQVKVINTDHLEVTSAADCWFLEMNSIGRGVAILCGYCQNAVFQIHCLTVHLLDESDHRQLFGDDIVLSYLRIQDSIAYDEFLQLGVVGQGRYNLEGVSLFSCVLWFYLDGISSFFLVVANGCTLVFIRQHRLNIQ